MVFCNLHCILVWLVDTTYKHLWSAFVLLGAECIWWRDVSWCSPAHTCFQMGRWRNFYRSWTCKDSWGQIHNGSGDSCPGFFFHQNRFTANLNRNSAGNRRQDEWKSKSTPLCMCPWASSTAATTTVNMRHLLQRYIQWRLCPYRSLTCFCTCNTEFKISRGMVWYRQSYTLILEWIHSAVTFLCCSSTVSRSSACCGLLWSFLSVVFGVFRCC